MPQRRYPIKIIIFTALAASVAAVLYLFVAHKSSTAPPVADTPFVYTPPDNREKIPQPSGARTLRDSTRVLVIGDSKITPLPGFPAPRSVKVDGDLFFEVPAATKPLIVRTRLLTLTVTGKAVFRVIAYDKEDGEEVQVIAGNIHVKKAYKSQFDEPETLTDNQMVMINITIDLMEKENFDTRDLRAWRDTVRIPGISP